MADHRPDSMASGKAKTRHGADLKSSVDQGIHRAAVMDPEASASDRNARKAREENWNSTGYLGRPLPSVTTRRTARLARSR